MKNPALNKALLWTSGIILVACLTLFGISISSQKTGQPSGFNDYRISAESGNAQSQWILGRYYFSGEDVPKNHALSSYWFRKSAEKNHTEACYDLGIHYMGGVGVETNYLNAAFWLQKAIFSANPYTSGSAQIALGDMYSRGGFGLQQDRFEAYAWYAIAAKGSYATTRDNAKRKLAEWGSYIEKDSLSDQYTLAHDRFEKLSGRIEKMKIDEQLYERISEEHIRR